MHKIFFKIRAIDFKIRFNSLQLIGFPIQYGNVMTYHHIVVDDNSTDGCADIAAVLIRKQAYKTPCDYAGRAIRLSLFRLSLSLHQEVRFLRYSVREYPVWCLKNLLSVAWSEKFSLLAICCIESLVCSSILTISPIRELHIQS